MDLEQAIALLAAHPDRTVVVNLLKTKAGAIHHEIHQEGYNGGYGKRAGEMQAAADRLTETQAKLTKAEADLVEARKANPDVAKLHTDYQQKLADVEAAAKRAVDEANGRVKGKERARALAQLESLLVAAGVKQGVPARLYARDYEDRLDVDEKGELVVLQPGMTIPFAATAEKPALQLLAEAIRAKVPAVMIESRADGGSGDQGGGAGLTGQAKLVADIKAKAEADRAAREAARAKVGPDGVPTALSGMGIQSK